MPLGRLPNLLLLPELRFCRSKAPQDGTFVFEVEKTSSFEVCPKCASQSFAVYDRRSVTIKDAPIRERKVLLRIRKRRFFCKPCGRPFTEPVRGITKGRRHTMRYQRSLLYACETYSSLKRVQHQYGCSAGFLYTALYRELKRKARMRESPWPKVVGLDEHFFRRQPMGSPFVTMVVDYNGKCLREVVWGKSQAELRFQLAGIPGRQNVRWVVCDLADPYKSFAKDFFPHARVVADKFHVLRLLNPALHRHRKTLITSKEGLHLRRLLLTPGKRLKQRTRANLLHFLNKHPTLNQLYHAKESLWGFYRIRGVNRAKKAFTKMLDAFALSNVPELKTLRKTLLRWRNEILAYFECRITNARTEGFNNVAKVVKKRAYGYRNFENYRLRLLNTCMKRHF